ncbi:MAG: glycoside hydrolase family 127 protein [Armatimonadetes bacterium]|nr:glycoside hydrolase family 127 protein [Armatimonadota bacterium]
MVGIALALFAVAQVGPYRVADKLPDVFHESSPSDVHLGGYIGQRIADSEVNRLRTVDLKPLLEGFHHRPGSHPWIGEHIGKWIHAATLAWANERDPELKTKLDAAVKELISCQEPDGYLGTYTPDKRFGLYENADWDVWVHKYDQIGLLTYYRFTGYKPALDCSRKIGDLMIATFGPGKKNILSAGTHMGMAATSILEPMTLLYRHTGEAKYLDFAKYIVSSWEEPGGPKIMSTLEAGKPIDQVGNGKAYEMLSNLVGLCELARATGEKRYLHVAELAWDDIVKHELYITGTASYYEHFHPGTDLPNQTSKNVGETCVTVTWMQLCQQLLRLTGGAKYAEEFERSEYNHLAAAQKPDGSAWCYYTSLEGKKPYTTETCCCLSSGPRGMAIIPETAYMTGILDGQNTVFVNTLETSHATVNLPGSTTTVDQQSSFPNAGKSNITFATHFKAETPMGAAKLAIRIPKWATNFRADVPGTIRDGWYVIKPKREVTLRVHLSFDMPLVKNESMIGGETYLAWTKGPFVLCKDMSKAADDGLVRFADVVDDRYRIWLPTQPLATSAFQDAKESRSVEGNVDGSICDGDPGTFVVTFDGKKHESAWFALNLESPVEVSHFEFVQGGLFHDGGWFDSSVEPPKFEVQIAKGGKWMTIAPVVGYPKTTATDRGSLKAGDAFKVDMLKSVKVYGVRVIGTPACGDNPLQSFASCGELIARP